MKWRTLNVSHAKSCNTLVCDICQVGTFFVKSFKFFGDKSEFKVFSIFLRNLHFSLSIGLFYTGKSKVLCQLNLCAEIKSSNGGNKWFFSFFVCRSNYKRTTKMNVSCFMQCDTINSQFTLNSKISNLTNLSCFFLPVHFLSAAICEWISCYRLQ